MNRHDYHQHRMQHHAIIHALLATTFAIYCMFYTCGEGKTFLNDEDCRLVPRNSHVWLCYFTASYLLVDTFWLVFFVGLHSDIDRQTLLHHLIGFSNYYIAFWQ